jgi:hypothetical protein
MSSSTKATTTQSDAAFNKQIEAAREALKNFSAIIQLNAPGPAKLAMEELVNITVSAWLFKSLWILLTRFPGSP